MNSDHQLPSLLRIESELTKIASNSGWIIGEQVIRLVAGLFTSILIARHLGPDGLGILNYALAFSSIFAIAATAGLNRILVRELAKNADNHKECQTLVITAFFVRCIASLAVYLAAVSCAYFADQPAVLLIAIVSWSILFSPADVIDLFFQSRSLSKRSSIAKVFSTGFGVILRAMLVAFDAGITAFAFVSVAEAALLAGGLILLYGERTLIRDRGLLNASVAKKLVGESWPEVLAGFGGLIFLRLDQVMLANMTNATTVGIYSVASRLSESWYFVPAALVTSSFPSIVRSRQIDPIAYMRSIAHLMRGMVVLSYLAVAAALIFGHPVISLLFGDDFSSAAGILTIHIWCGLFLSMGIASGSWMMAEGFIRMNLYRNLLGALCNIFLNLFLIPLHGPKGAAYATLVSVFVAYFLFDFLLPSTRKIAIIKTRSLILLSLPTAQRKQS